MAHMFMWSFGPLLYYGTKKSPRPPRHGTVQVPTDYHAYDDADLEMLHNLGIHTKARLEALPGKKCTGYFRSRSILGYFDANMR